MAILINSQPEKILLSKNPILFDLSTENYVTTEGVKAQKRIDLSGSTPSAGDTMILEAPGLLSDGVTGDDITWTFSSTPDDSGLQLPAFPGGDVIPYIQNLILYMMMNPAFNRSYVAYCDGFQAVTIRALNDGPDWDQTWTFTGFSPTITQNIAGALSVLEEDFQVRARVTLDKGFGELIIGEYEYKVPDSSGNLTWDLSDTVDRLFPVDWMPEHPIVDAFTIINPPDSGQVILNVEFMEYYGETPHNNPTKTTDHFRVLKGGFSSYDKSESLITQFSDETKFMTWREDGVEIHQDSRNWLHFLNIDPLLARTHLRLGVNITNLNGPSVQIEPLTSLLINYGALYFDDGIFSIPCGYDQLRLNLFNPGQTPLKYSIRVYDNTNTNLAGPFTFYVKKPSKLAASLLYFNSFGLPEELSLDGEQILSSEGSFKTLLLPRNPSPTPADLTDLDYNHRVNSEMTLSTGAIRKSDSRALNEILLSPKLWLMKKDGVIYKKFAVRLKESSFRNGIKDFGATNSLPERITLQLNEERSFSKINDVWQ